MSFPSKKDVRHIRPRLAEGRPRKKRREREFPVLLPPGVPAAEVGRKWKRKCGVEWGHARRYQGERVFYQRHPDWLELLFDCANLIIQGSVSEGSDASSSKSEDPGASLTWREKVSMAVAIAGGLNESCCSSKTPKRHIVQWWSCRIYHLGDPLLGPASLLPDWGAEERGHAIRGEISKLNLLHIG